MDTVKDLLPAETHNTERILGIVEAHHSAIEFDDLDVIKSSQYQSTCQGPNRSTTLEAIMEHKKA